MEKTVNAVKTLRETLWARSVELESLIMELEEKTCGLDPEEQETDEAQELIHKTSLAYDELRLNDKLLQAIDSMRCDYCRLDPDRRLCDFCPR